MLKQNIRRDFILNIIEFERKYLIKIYENVLSKYVAILLLKFAFTIHSNS